MRNRSRIVAAMVGAGSLLGAFAIIAPSAFATTHTDQSAEIVGVGSATTASISNTSPELAVALVSVVDTSAGVQTSTVSDASAAPSMDWVLAGRENTQNGDVEVWTATTAGSAFATKATSNDGSHTVLLDVRTYSGALRVAQVVHQNSASGVPLITVNPTVTGGIVDMVGINSASGTLVTVRSGNGLLHADTASTNELWDQNVTGNTTVGTAAVVGVTAPTAEAFNALAIEIVPSAAGVSLANIDGGPTYYSQWTNRFPTGTYPIGVFPFEAAPSALHTVGVNYGTPMRDDAHNAWTPVYNCSGACVNDQTSVNAQAGFYSGGDYEGAGSPAWGSKAVFNVFGDELDGQCANGLFDNNPTNVTTAGSTCGAWGGTTAAGLEAANADTKTNDPSRPVYDQFTDTFTGLTQDGSYGSQYTDADQAAVCASTNILSFDLYPIVKRGGDVFDTYNDVAQMRSECSDAKPIFPFIEMDHMDSGTIYPTPAQTNAEVWNAVIAGAGGVQYFDQYGNLTNATYTGGGTYAAGAMYNQIQSTDAEIATLTPVIQAPTVSGFVTSTGNVKTLVKDVGGTFYLFAAAHAAGSQAVTFTVPAGFSTATGLNGTTSATISSGTFSATFADANAVKIYKLG